MANSYRKVFAGFTAEINKAAKEFSNEFNVAVNHDPILGKGAENFAYGISSQKDKLKHKISDMVNSLEDRVKSTSAIEKECNKFKNSVEHMAEDLAKKVDRFARNKLGINLAKVGKAFGEFFERIFNAVTNLIGGIKEVAESKHQAPHVKATSHHR